MRKESIDYFISVTITSIILIILLYLCDTNKFKQFRSDQVTARSNPENFAPGGIKHVQNGRIIVEDDLYPARTPSTSDIIIMPKPSRWRVPQHPTIVPSVGNGGASNSFIEWLPAPKLQFPWTSFVFHDFPPTVIETWIKKINDNIEYPNRLQNWEWIPFPDNKLTNYKWHSELWTNRTWRAPLSESRSEAPPVHPLVFPDYYWSKWSMHWINRWNELYVGYLNTDVAIDRRSRTLDKPFQYNRIWYLQGWETTTHDNQKVRIMQYFGELTREFSDVVYIFDWIVIGNPDLSSERPLINVNWIGSRTYDQVWLPNGVDLQSITAQSTSPAVPPPSLLTREDVPNEMKRKRIFTEMERRALETSNVCFIPSGSKGDQYSTLIFASDRASCEDRLDKNGKPKPAGVWDHSCQKNSDCLFYMSNQNYQNNYGRCLENGRCQFPIGMKNLGYHYWIMGSKNEPYCYNCNSKSKSWKPVTELGKCCEEQKNRIKYPHLKSPDFAYPGDQADREHLFERTKCYISSDNEYKTCENRASVPQYPLKEVRQLKVKLSPIPAPTEGYDPYSNIVPGQTNVTFLLPYPHESNM